MATVMMMTTMMMMLVTMMTMTDDDDDNDCDDDDDDIRLKSRHHPDCRVEGAMLAAMKATIPRTVDVRTRDEFSNVTARWRRNLFQEAMQAPRSTLPTRRAARLLATTLLLVPMHQANVSPPLPIRVQAGFLIHPSDTPTSNGTELSAHLLEVRRFSHGWSACVGG